MPEIAEIHRFGIVINTKLDGVIFNNIRRSDHAKFSNFPSFSGRFGLAARFRGKELAIDIKSIEASTSSTTIWNFGLVGRFIVHKPQETPGHALVTFISEDASVALSYVDSQKMGRWRLDDFDRKRGPDPVLDHTAFAAHVLASASKAAFTKPLAEVLLNQDFFNGIGNYLRAEVCYRAGISPFASAASVFLNAPAYNYDSVNASSPKSHLILYLCRAIPLEVLEKGLNKYGNEEEQKKFHDWLRIYDKGEQKDLNGRKVHYASTQLTQPDLPTLTQSLPLSGSPVQYPKSFKIGETSVVATSPVSPSDLAFDDEETPSVAPSSSTPLSFSSQHARPASTTSPFASTVAPSAPQLTSASQSLAPSHLVVFNENHKENARPLNASRGAVFPHSLFDVKEMLLSPSTTATARSLLLLSRLAKSARINNSEKDILKMMALIGHDGLVSAVDVFLADFDLEELVDTCHLLAQNGLPQNYAYTDKAKAGLASTPHQASLAPPSAYVTSSTPPVNPYSNYLSQSTAPNAYTPVLGFAPQIQIAPTPTHGFALAPSPAVTSGSPPSLVPSSLIDAEWREKLSSECASPYFQNILSFVAAERAKVIVFPPEDEVFSAFNFTPLSQVKVVIIGQDPYFNDGQAHGLCFSVRKGVKPPPSLVRIYKVIEKTVRGFTSPAHGYLESWARQGVLLLNATLTVEKGKPNSHANCGWQRFTDRVIEILNKEKDGLVFMLWGGFAQAKGAKIDRSRHKVLEASHPSPMSGSAWNDCTHFRDANEYLASKKKPTIDWRL